MTMIEATSHLSYDYIKAACFRIYHSKWVFLLNCQCVCIVLSGMTCKSQLAILINYLVESITIDCCLPPHM